MHSFTHILSFILLSLTFVSTTPIPRSNNPSSRTVLDNEAAGVPAALARRQDTSVGINRDESFNFQSDNLGDSVNSGVGNIFSPTSTVSGVGNAVLIRALLDTVNEASAAFAKRGPGSSVDIEGAEDQTVKVWGRQSFSVSSSSIYDIDRSINDYTANYGT